MFCSRFCAVTTMSPKPSEGELAASVAGGTGSCAAAIAGNPANIVAPIRVRRTILLT